jgi:hypothetical protein
MPRAAPAELPRWMHVPCKASAELSVLTVRRYNPCMRNPILLRIACIAVLLLLLCATRAFAQSSSATQDSTTNAPSATDKPAPVAPAHGPLPSCTVYTSWLA